MTATVTTAVDDADLGVVGAATQTTYQIGTVLGMQALQTVQVAFEPTSGVVSSYETAFRFGAVVALVGLVVASCMGRRDRSLVTASRRRLARAALRGDRLTPTSGAAEPA